MSGDCCRLAVFTGLDATEEAGVADTSEGVVGAVKREELSGACLNGEASWAVGVGITNGSG